MAGLLREMERHGVGRAVVWHARQSVSPIEGNTQLLKLLSDQPQLTPLFSAIPVDECLANLQQIAADGRLTAVRWAGL